MAVAYAYLMDGLDEEGAARVDRSLVDPTPPSRTERAAEMLRARSPRPRRGAPPDALRQPPARPEGIPLAPDGVRIRDPEPTRGLEVLAAAMRTAPATTRARPAVKRG